MAWQQSQIDEMRKLIDGLYAACKFRLNNTTSELNAAEIAYQVSSDKCKKQIQVIIEEMQVYEKAYKSLSDNGSDTKSK